MPFVSDRDLGLVQAVHEAFGWQDASDVAAFAFNFRRIAQVIAAGGTVFVDQDTHELVARRAEVPS